MSQGYTAYGASRRKRIVVLPFSEDPSECYLTDSGDVSGLEPLVEGDAQPLREHNCQAPPQLDPAYAAEYEKAHELAKRRLGSTKDGAAMYRVSMEIAEELIRERKASEAAQSFASPQEKTASLFSTLEPVNMQPNNQYQQPAQDLSPLSALSAAGAATLGPPPYTPQPAVQQPVYQQQAPQQTHYSQPPVYQQQPLVQQPQYSQQVPPAPAFPATQSTPAQATQPQPSGWCNLEELGDQPRPPRYAARILQNGVDVYSLWLHLVVESMPTAVTLVQDRRVLQRDASDIRAVVPEDACLLEIYSSEDGQTVGDLVFRQEILPHFFQHSLGCLLLTSCFLVE